MKTISLKLYEFSELSEKAKQKALETYTQDAEYFWGNDAMESLKQFVDHFNCTLKDYGIDFLNPSQSTVAFDVPDYVNRYSVQELFLSIKGMGSYDKKTLKGYGDCKFTGFCMDEAAADGARMAWFQGERDVRGLLMAGFSAWHKAVTADYEHQLSAEGYAEHCEANEYTFEEDGTIRNIK